MLRVVESCWELLRGVERCWEVLRGVERCWEVLRGVGRDWEVLGGILNPVLDPFPCQTRVDKRNLDQDSIKMTSACHHPDKGLSHYITSTCQDF